MTLVVAYHCSILPFGWMGVWIFYVISGYVITLTLLTDSQIDAAPKVRYHAFIVRRIFRIVPVYLFYLAINIPFVFQAHRVEAFKEMPFLLAFVYNWQTIYQFIDVRGWSGYAHLWTLSVEEQFYLFYPFLLFLLPPRRFVLVVAGLIALGPLVRWETAQISSSISQDPDWIALTVYLSSLCHFDAFLAGAALAVARRRIMVDKTVAAWIWAVSVSACVLYVLVYLKVNLDHGATGWAAFKNIVSGTLYGQGREVFIYSAVALGAISVMIAILQRRRWTRSLGWQPIASIGKVSYGGYLYHLLVLHVLGLILSDAWYFYPIHWRVAIFVVAWALTVLVAQLSFNLFEMRLIRVGQTLSHHARRESGVALAGGGALRPTD